MFRQLGGFDNIKYREITNKGKSLLIEVYNIDKVKLHNLFFFGITSHSLNSVGSGELHFYSPAHLCNICGLDYKINELVDAVGNEKSEK